MNIYSSVTGKTPDEIEIEFEGNGYGDFKAAVAEAVAETLKPIQSKYKEYISDKEYLKSVYRAGAERAARVARKTVSKVYRKVGFTEP